MIMRQIKWVLLILACIGYPIISYANPIKLHLCKDFPGFHEIKRTIASIDKTFRWDTTDCKIIGTKSIFPRKNKNGLMGFATGLQLFIYNNYQLKFICLPGWICHPWESAKQPG